MRSLESRAKVFYFRIPRKAVLAFALIVLVPWAVVAVLSFRQWPSATLSGANWTAASKQADMKHCQPGPWGNIEYVDIVTQPPDEFMSPNFFTQAQVAWVFKGYTKADLYELLASAELTEAQRIAIDSAVEFSAAANQCVVKPGRDLIMGLSPKSRAAIYAVLGKFPANAGQRDPFIFRPHQLNEWLDDGGLQPRTVDLVKGLLYPHGNYVLFSDCCTVMDQLPEADERVRLLKVLFRRNAVFPRLHLTPDSDLKALTSYWGKGGREMVISPLLHSLPRTPNGIDVNVVLLLPPFARERLYTYPLPTPETKGVSRDCHWTALNFFNDPPDDRCGQSKLLFNTIQNDYYPVPGSPSFGDLVLFFTPEHDIIHSAVYVADDIFFTKNGPHYTSPWLLETRDEVLAAFPAYGKLDVSYYRAKKL